MKDIYIKVHLCGAGNSPDFVYTHSRPAELPGLTVYTSKSACMRFGWLPGTDDRLGPGLRCINCSGEYNLCYSSETLHGKAPASNLVFLHAILISYLCSKIVVPPFSEPLSSKSTFQRICT